MRKRDKNTRLETERRRTLERETERQRERDRHRDRDRHRQRDIILTYLLAYVGGLGKRRK